MYLYNLIIFWRNNGTEKYIWFWNNVKWMKQNYREEIIMLNPVSFYLHNLII